MLPLALAPGVPAYQHDWLWPASRWQCASYAWLGFTPWLPNGTGMPAAYPQAWEPYAVAGSACGLFGPHAALCVLLLSIIAVGTISICRLTNALAAVTPAGLGAAVLVFWGNPVILNEVQAGHIFFLWSYALIPAVLELAVRRRGIAHAALYTGAVVALAGAQQQFLAFGILSIVVLVMATYKRDDISYLLSTLGCAAAITSPAWILSLVASPMTLFGAQHAQIHWEYAQSAGFADAIRLTGYIGHYDGALPAMSTMALFLSPAIAAIVLVTQARRKVIAALGDSRIRWHTGILGDVWTALGTVYILVFVVSRLRIFPRAI